MRVEKDDFVITQVGQKKHLAKIIKNTEGKNIKARVDSKNNHSPQLAKENVVDLDKNDIFLCLGKSPDYGTAYGVKVEPYIDSFYSNPWGIVYLFRHLTDGEFYYLKKSLKETGIFIKNIGLTDFLPIEVLIRNNIGKRVGCYLHKRKEEEYDELQLFPKEIVSLNQLKHLISHEFAHHIWFRYMEEKERSKWIKLYHKSVAVSKLNKKDLKKYLDGLENENNIKFFNKNLDKQEKEIFKEIILWIKKTHKLEKDDIDDLLKAGESIAGYWPSEIDIGDMDISISEYAKKNSKEFFAEAFCHYFQPLENSNKIPEKIETRLLNLLNKITKINKNKIKTEREKFIKGYDKKKSKKSKDKRK